MIAGGGPYVHQLQLLGNSVGPDSPAGSPSSRKAVGGGGGDGNGAGGEGEDLGLGRVPSGVSRWAGVGAVEKLKVRRRRGGGGTGGGVMKNVSKMGIEEEMATNDRHCRCTVRRCSILSM